MLTTLAGAGRVLCVGIGGGGDVAGALVVAEAAGALGVPALVGGLTWERRPIDPHPGPRRLSELHGVEPLNQYVALADHDAGGPGGFLFAEAHVARATGERTVLVDPGGGPEAVGVALAEGARLLGCDLVILFDVGGDVLAHGDEAGLASPLADAVLLAAAPHVAAAGIPVAGAVFGAGCDGELEPDEVLARWTEVVQAGGGLGVLGPEPGTLDRLEPLVAQVPTEASAMALRCARGETGDVAIRDGRRTVRLTPLGGLVLGFDPLVALRSAARCAAAVRRAASLEEADALLRAAGVRTELAYEEERAAGA